MHLFSFNSVAGNGEFFHRIRLAKIHLSQCFYTGFGFHFVKRDFEPKPFLQLSSFTKPMHQVLQIFLCNTIVIKSITECKAQQCKES